MKGRHIIWTGIIALAVGILMIIYNRALEPSTLVMWCGILFILAGVLNLTLFLTGRDPSGKPKHNPASMMVGWVASAAAVVLGLCMVLFRATFVELVGYMFAFLLLFAALFQVFLLAFGARPTRLSGGWYVVPTVIVGIAVYFFLQRPVIENRYMMLWTGIAFALFGAASVVEGAQIGANNRSAAKAAKAEAPDGKKVIEARHEEEPEDPAADFKPEHKSLPEHAEQEPQDAPTK